MHETILSLSFLVFHAISCKTFFTKNIELTLKSSKLFHLQKKKKKNHYLRIMVIFIKKVYPRVQEQWNYLGDPIQVVHSACVYGIITQVKSFCVFPRRRNCPNDPLLFDTLTLELVHL